MARKRLSVQLAPDEYAFLTTYVAHGQKNARAINRARTLLMAHDGKANQEIVDMLSISSATLYKVRKKYHQRSYDHIVEILQDKPRKKYPMAFDAEVETNIARIARSQAPEGTARWTLRSIADRLVQLRVVDSISHESVRNLLKKNNVRLG